MESFFALLQRNDVDRQCWVTVNSFGSQSTPGSNGPATAGLVETLYRSRADNSVGKTIEVLLRKNCSSSTKSELSPRGHPHPTALVPDAHERPSIAIASH